MIFRRSLIPFLIACFSSVCARGAVPSPKASTEIICHTNHASECYPKIFQPTEKFRTVHDDQDLPAGLHVRMNLATGVKEARLNIPESDDEEKAISGLTIIDNSDDHSDFELVDYEEPPLADQGIHQQQQPIHLPTTGDVAESSLYTSSVAEIKEDKPSDTDTLLPALTDLEDLSHSYHWGLTLSQDKALVHRIFQLLLPATLSLQVRSLATLVLGTAIHNNEAALTAALSHFYNDEWPEGPLQAVILALMHERAPVLLNRMLFFLSSLCKDPAQLERFLAADGARLLMDLYRGEAAGSGDDNAKMRKKVTNFVFDYLISAQDAEEIENMGGLELGEEWTMIHLHQAIESHDNNARESAV
ncbi:MAG: hypothetical protein Q9174_004004 [Haloplaca sp. 1 TL-2023]